jgi:hypothetical protein
MDRFFVSYPVTYPLEYFYFAIAIFPLLIIVACLISYFAVGIPISTLPSGAHIPTYSELVVASPQNRIWAVGMSLQGLFLLLFGVLRDHMLQLHVSRSAKQSIFLCQVLVQVTRVLLILSSFALMILACAPIDKEALLHEIAAAFFFFGLSFYFFVGDYLTWTIKKPIKIVSIVLTAGNVVLIVVAVIVRYSNSNPAAYDTASVLSYLAAIGLFAKLVLIKMDMPKHGLRLSRRLVHEQVSEHESG